MAAGKQTLTVGIDADTSGLIKATDQASKALEGLKKDVGALDAEPIDVRVDTDAAQAAGELQDLKKATDTLDSEAIAIPAEIQMQNVNRDLANLKKVLDGIELRKASPDVGIDITQLLRDEAKVKKVISELEAEKLDIEGSINVDVTGGTLSGIGGIANLLGEVQESLREGGGGGLGGGLTSLAGGLRGVGAGGATAAAGLAGVAVGVGAAAAGAWELSEAAADVETSVSQLGALVGDQDLGAQTFADLQKWAASTPFAIEDATEATKKLVAAGVPLKKLPDYLNQLGNVASATGVPLDQMAVVFAQMESSGKASYENIQQLAEAGIPAWTTLSDKLGIAVGDLQELAIKGKLPVETIQLLRESMNELYPSAMQDQAKTFNGQMSTLNDNLSQTGQTLGTIVLPLMTDLVEGLNKVAGGALAASGKLADFSGWLEQKTGLNLGDYMINSLVPGFRKVGDNADDATGEVTNFGSVSESVLTAVSAAVHETEADVKLLEKAFKNAVDQFSKIGADVRLRVSFILDRANLEEEIRKATTGKKEVDLPANLNIKQLSGLSDKQEKVVGDLSTWVQQGLDRGAEKADLAQQMGTEFDADKYYRDMRKKLRPMLIEANIDPSQVDRVMTNIFGIPKPVKVQPELVDLTNTRRDYDAAFGDKHPKIQPGVDAGAARNDIGELVKPRKTEINAEANTGEANKELNHVARDRITHIDLVFNESLYDHMENRLDRLARARHIQIYGGGPTATGQGVPGTLMAAAGEPSLMAAATTVASQPGGFPLFSAPRPARGVPVERAVTQLAPRQTPVVVHNYLDGHEIGNRVQATRVTGPSRARRRA
jgi:tape measure domain-containing protein